MSKTIKASNHHQTKAKLKFYFVLFYYHKTYQKKKEITSNDWRNVHVQSNGEFVGVNPLVTEGNLIEEVLLVRPTTVDMVWYGMVEDITHTQHSLAIPQRYNERNI